MNIDGIRDHIVRTFAKWVVDKIELLESRVGSTERTVIIQTQQGASVVGLRYGPLSGRGGAAVEANRGIYIAIEPTYTQLFWSGPVKSDGTWDWVKGDKVRYVSQD